MAISFLIKTIDGECDGGVEFLDGTECLVCEEVPLEVAPGALDVVEFGRVLGQPLDGQPSALLKGGAGQLADMDRPVIEHQDHRSCCAPECRPVELIKTRQQADEIGAALGPAAMDN